MRVTTCTAAALAAAVVAAVPAAADAKGFKYGVTASEITSSGALLWTRPDKAGSVTLDLSADGKFGNADDRHKTLKAYKSNDNTVQIRIGGLKAGHVYRYRFTQGSAAKKRRHPHGNAEDYRTAQSISAVGRFTTAPSANQNKTIRFAYSGDSDAQRAKGQKKPFWNNFQVYLRMAQENNLFNINFGDTIYSDTEVGAQMSNGTFKPVVPIARTVSAKWAKYRQNVAMPNLQRVRAAAGMYNHWDDHEFINDFTKAEMGTAIYKAGVTAFRDYMPVTYSSKRGIYRSFRWGKNAEVFFLDERSFRSAKASVNPACNNPQTGAPDLAPTAPPRLRTLFSVAAPSLSKPVNPACIATIKDPKRTMLGADQYKRFTNAVKASTAKFKIIMNETPMQMFYALPYDRWEGYEAERQKLLSFLKNNVKNVVVLTTDTHANLYNDVRFSTFPEEGGPVNSGINEMVTGPAATKSFSKEIDEATGNSNAGTLVTGAFFKPPPPNGVGMVCANTNVFSYTEVTVTSTAVTLTPKDINGKPVKDSTGAPCGPFVIPAT